MSSIHSVRKSQNCTNDRKNEVTLVYISYLQSFVVVIVSFFPFFFSLEFLSFSKFTLTEKKNKKKIKMTTFHSIKYITIYLLLRIKISVLLALSYWYNRQITTRLLQLMTCGAGNLRTDVILTVLL